MSQSSYRSVMKQSGTKSLLATLFLGALNDNIFKMILSLKVVAAAASTGEAGSAVALVGAIFMLPFLLGSGYAGFLADRFSKRQVMVCAKVLEIGVMTMALVAFVAASTPWLIAVLALMALQSTIFGPAKYGILPEIYRESDLTRANGLVEGATFLAIILGTSLGGLLYAGASHAPLVLGLVMVLLAGLGSATSLGIPRTAAASADLPFSLNPWTELGAGLQAIRRQRELVQPVLGIALFWFIGALVQMNLMLFAQKTLGLGESMTGILAAGIALGIGAGSMLAGRLSGERIEPGLVPIGLLGLTISCIGVAVFAESGALVAGALVLMGVSGGLFSVPLYATVQHRSPDQRRGQIMATVNLISTLAMLAASVVLHVCQTSLTIGPRGMHLVIAAVALVAFLQALRTVPSFFVRFLLWCLFHIVYRIRINGRENIPQRGPALLVANHVSFIDAPLVAACIQRFVRFLAFRSFCEMPVLGRALRWMHAIPVDGEDRRGVVRAILRSRRELEEGHVVCIFAEGKISRDGTLGPFRPGLERIAQDLNIPVIPVRLDGVWGSIFSFSGGRAFWKRPRPLSTRVTLTFGKPLSADVKAEQVREAIVALSEQAA